MDALAGHTIIDNWNLGYREVGAWGGEGNVNSYESGSRIASGAIMAHKHTMNLAMSHRELMMFWRRGKATFHDLITSATPSIGVKNRSQ